MNASAPSPPASRAPALPDLMAWQVAALRRYAQDFDKAQRVHASRIEAVDDLKAARAALPSSQFAVVDFVAGRGFSIPALAAKSGRKAADLAALLYAAANKLGRHYEATAGGGTEGRPDVRTS